MNKCSYLKSKLILIYELTCTRIITYISVQKKSKQYKHCKLWTDAIISFNQIAEKKTTFSKYEGI